MKLLIDIGNTNSSLAIVRDGKIVNKFYVRTSREEISKKSLNRLLKRYLLSIDTIIVVSVVPKFYVILKSSLKQLLYGIKILLVGKDILVPLKNKYKKPEEVGQDRLVTSFGGLDLYGSPLLSIDFGSAVTFDYVNKKGEYEGGLIFPGIRLSLESLVNKTALLPGIELKPLNGCIGRNTYESMTKGILLGYASMCDGIIDKFQKQYGNGLKIISTGGDAELIKKYSKKMKKIYPDLIFYGLLKILMDY